MAPSAAPKQDFSPASTAGERLLLLIEDETDAREVLARRLPLVGWRCLAHPCVESALTDPGLAQIDAAVADVVLRDEASSGIDFIRALAQRGINVPVVLMTAFADRSMLLRAIDAGAAFFLEKPFGVAQLRSALETVMNRRADAIARMVDQPLARARLTKKEKQVARLALRGMTNAQIAAATANAESTIRQHLGEIYGKLGVTTRAEFFHLIFPT